MKFLHHQIDAPAHLLRQERQFHIILILVAVADDKGIFVGIDGQYGVQLRFGAGFKADVVLVAVAHYLFHHLAHLVHLDWIDNEVLAGVPVFFGCTLEAV